MSAKFTPGPWAVYPGTDGNEICAVDHSPGLPIRQVICGPRRGENWIANAHLIAAAPDMYEALQDLIALAEHAMREAGDYDINGELEDARAALAKARGEA